MSISSSRHRDETITEVFYKEQSGPNKAIVQTREPFTKVANFKNRSGRVIREGGVYRFSRIPNCYGRKSGQIEVLSIYWDPLSLPGGSALCGKNDDGYEEYRCRLRLVVKVLECGVSPHIEGRQFKGDAGSLDYYLIGG